MPPTPLHILLGGHDLEMVTLAALARDTLGAERVHDAGLSWGAQASAYEGVIRDVLGRGETPVLVELADDLPADIPRQSLVVVDHHGPLAHRPSSLEQVFALLGLPKSAWTRRLALVAGNDVGHVRRLREMGATADEIRAVRDADRAAQGVTPAEEAAAREALARARRMGRLLVVDLPHGRTSPVGDLLEPEYGGPGVENLLVLTPATANFFGDGAVIRALSDIPRAWSGGALPERGFWGAPREAAGADIEGRIAALLG